MTLHVAFQMEPLAEVNPVKGTTFRMIQEAARRGHRLFHYVPSSLAWTDDGLSAYGAEFVFKGWKEGSQAPWWEIKREYRLPLSECQIVHMRQDPPFDMAYMTAAYLLETLPPSTWVLNPPASVRNAPEKLMPLRFPEFIPPTLISRDANEVFAFVEKHGEIILKPLYAFSGRDVLHFRKGDSNLGPAIDMFKRQENVPFICQAYIPEVVKGDTRVLIIDGEIVGAFRRVPQAGQHRANLMAGGSLEPTTLDARSKAICNAVIPVLQQEGLFLTGLDIIGSYLTEINVTSPMGFAQVEKLTGRDPGVFFWDRIEARYSERMSVYTTHARVR